MVSTGFILVSAVVVVGTLAVVIMTVGFEVTRIVSFLVVVAGKDMVVSGITLVETVVGPAVTTSGGCVVD